MVLVRVANVGRPLAGAIVVIVCVTGLAACGPTHQEVAVEFKARVLEKKAGVVAAARLLEESDRDSVPFCDDARIPLQYAQYGASNTLIAMHEWLLNLDDPFHEIPFNLTNSYAFTESLDWVSEPNPRGSVKDETAVEGFREQFEQALGYEYLVLNEARNFIEPKVISSDTFQPGSVDITMFVLTIDPGAVLCRASFTATTAERVTAHSFADFPDPFQANFAIRSSLFDDARERQGAILEAVSELADR